MTNESAPAERFLSAEEISFFFRRQNEDDAAENDAAKENTSSAETAAAIVLKKIRPLFRRAVELLGGRPDFSLLIGPEELTLPALRMGGDGGVNGGANLRPELFAALFRSVRENDAGGRIDALQREIVELGRLYRTAPGAPGVIRGLKYELARLGVIENVLAFPSCPLREKP